MHIALHCIALARISLVTRSYTYSQWLGQQLYKAYTLLLNQSVYKIVIPVHFGVEWLADMKVLILIKIITRR